MQRFTRRRGGAEKTTTPPSSPSAPPREKKAGWETKTIGDVCEVIAGQSPEGKFYNAEGKGMPFYQGKKDFGDKFIEAPTTWTTHTTKIAKEGDILMSVRAPVGPVNFATDEVCIGRGLAAIRSGGELNRDFLFYQLWHLQPEIAGREGAVFASINKAEIEALPLSYAPLAEQQRIVGLLDEAFEGLATAKANAEKNLQNARALFESHLQSVFTQRGPGWVEKPLGDLCDFLNGFAFKSGDAVVESQTQLVRMGNLYGNQLDLDRSPVFYPDSFSTEHSRYVLEEGDIIMSLTGTTGKEDYGFAVRIPDCGHTLLMNQRIMKFDAIRRDIINDGYLLHYLRSRCFLDILYPTANGTRQANLSSVTMKLLPVPLLSLKEQQAIASKFDALVEETQRLARLSERKHAALEALKKSLLQQAFTGAL